MTISRRAALAALAACGHAAPPATVTNHAPPPSWSIAPGTALGALALGMTAAEARAAAGAPDRTLASGDTTALLWLGDVAPDADGYDVHQPGYAPLHDTVIALVQDGRIVQLEASSPRFHTDDGVMTTAATVDALARARPDHVTRAWHVSSSDPGDATPACKHFVWYDDEPTAGLAVKYGAWGCLAPDPDTGARPEAIVVHAPGAALVLDPIDSLPYAGHAEHAFDTPLRADWLVGEEKIGG